MCKLTQESIRDHWIAINSWYPDQLTTEETPKPYPDRAVEENQ